MIFDFETYLKCDNNIKTYLENNLFNSIIHALKYNIYEDNEKEFIISSFKHICEENKRLRNSIVDLELKTVRSCIIK